MPKRIVAAVVLAILAGVALWAMRPRAVERVAPVVAPTPAPAPPPRRPPVTTTEVPPPVAEASPPEPTPTPPPPEPKREFRDWEVQGVVRSTDGLAVVGATITPVLTTDRVICRGASFVTPRESVLAELRPAIAPGMSDDQGRYAMRLRLTANAEFPVEIRARGFVPLDRTIQVMEQDADQAWDFVLERATGIEGRVVDREGTPVTRAKVGSFAPTGDVRSSIVTTGPDGRFRIPDSPTGECTVFVAPPDRPTGRWKRESLQRKARGGDRDVDLVLDFTETGATSTIRVRVVDPRTGETIVPRKVDVTPTDAWHRERFTAVPRKPVIGKEELTLEELPPGAWRVWVELPDKRTRYIDVVTGAEGGEVRATLEVKAPGNIEGHLDMNGLRFDPHNIQMMSSELRGNGSFPMFAIMDEEEHASKAEQVADAVPILENGSFRMDRLVAGSYRLSVMGDGVSACGDAEVLPGKTTRVELKARRSATAVFSLRPLAGCSWYRLSVWEDGGIRKPTNGREVKTSEAIQIRMEVHPGLIHWHLTWTDTASASGPAGQVPGKDDEIQEGTVEILPGETKSVAIPPAPR